MAHLTCCAVSSAQRIQFPPPNGVRPIDTGAGAMVPIAPGQGPLLPATTTAPGFDAFARPAQSGGFFGAPMQAAPAPVLGSPIPSAPVNPALTYGGPGTGAVAPPMPGVGQSAIVGTFPNNPTTYGQPGVYPNSAPSALFPGPYPNQQPSSIGTYFNNMYNGVFGQPGYNLPANPNWNPQGTVFGSSVTTPGFIRLFQGPRFRHAYIFGNDDTDALAINDSDLSLAFAVPNFLLSNQPLYLLPSFSLHQWDGPHPDATGDLPALAYSAFLDAGWQSDPVRILGAELGLRVGMFTDFDTANTDSLRIMGRGIGRVRLTPRATVKLGVIYLDRNDIKLLPAGGLLWQPNQNTRLDIFFPEPKFASYLTTFGNLDTWWYAGGFYGGGAWTIERADTSSDRIDINDLRIVVGLEFGRNEHMREGRRNAFIEFGYVFDRELLFVASPQDSLELQDTIMIRAGFGY